MCAGGPRVDERFDLAEKKALPLRYPTAARVGSRPRATLWALASYLLFEAPFTRELIALGESDTLARRHEVLQFFGWDASESLRGGRPDVGVMAGPPDIELP